jgi:3'-5' exoribonuclease
MELKHLVLSHHGRLEWGSPVMPKTPEAFILHFLDMIDSRMGTAAVNLKEIPPGEFSEKVWSLGTRLYKSPLSRGGDNG